MRPAYYNEIDPFAAAWLRELIAAGEIAAGDVDTRSITDVRADDLVPYGQCHFFAGIGGWSLALRLAGVPDDVPIWTGSCPCQPFSSAGRRAGTADERHLWPVMRDLVAVCRPPVIAGEQVASGLGLNWLASVRSDLEVEGYAVGASDLCAAGTGAPHLRQRLYWGAVKLADAMRSGRTAWRGESRHGPSAGMRPACKLADTDETRRGGERGSNRMGDAPGAEKGTRDQSAQALRDRRHDDGSDIHTGRSRPIDGGWSDLDWLFCRDGKWRPVEPGSFPLAHGVPNRVGRLRGYGNAIVPQVGAVFVRSFFEAAGVMA